MRKRLCHVIVLHWAYFFQNQIFLSFSQSLGSTKSLLLNRSKDTRASIHNYFRGNVRLMSFHDFTRVYMNLQDYRKSFPPATLSNLLLLEPCSAQLTQIWTRRKTFGCILLCLCSYRSRLPPTSWERKPVKWTTRRTSSRTSPVYNLPTPISGRHGFCFLEGLKTWLISTA